MRSTTRTLSHRERVRRADAPTRSQRIYLVWMALKIAMHHLSTRDKWEISPVIAAYRRQYDRLGLPFREESDHKRRAAISAMTIEAIK